MLFDEEHFQERYQLIMLIVMGEVVAAGAGVVSGSVSAIALPLSAIVTAFLCFLIAFVAQPAARRNPWACGHASRVHAPHAYLAMACSLAALGPAFARIVEEAGHHGKGPDEGEGASEGNEPSSGDAARADGCASVGLLYLSVGGFLIASASVHALGEDRAPSRCASSTRAAVQAILGLLMCVLVLVPGCNANLAAALVPGLLAPAHAVPVLGVRERRRRRRWTPAATRRGIGSALSVPTNESRRMNAGGAPYRSSPFRISRSNSIQM